MFRYTNACWAIVLLGAALATPAFAKSVPEKSSVHFRWPFRDITRDAAKGTVRILKSIESKSGKVDFRKAALGTVMSSDGWVLTKASLVRGAEKLKGRLRDGTEFVLKLASFDDESDLALLRAEGDNLSFTSVDVAGAKSTRSGSWVATVGIDDPEDRNLPMAVGVIGTEARKISVNEMMLATRTRGTFLGIRMNPAPRGVTVIEVTKDSAASSAGLLAGDVITGMAGSDIKSVDDLQAVLSRRKPGEEVPLRYMRGGREVSSKTIKLGRREGNPGRRAEFQNNMGSKLSDRRAGFPWILQHDSVVKPEDCGGPLVDLEGRVLGINIARAGRTLTVAIPGEQVNEVFRKLLMTRTQ